MVYLRHQKNQTPSLANTPEYKQPPTPGTWFSDQLNRILPRQWVTVYEYLYVYSIGIPDDVTIAARRLPNIYPTHCPNQFTGTHADIRIDSFVLVTIYNFIQLNVYDLIWLMVSDLIQLMVFDFIWLSFLSIWLALSLFISDLSHISWVPF